MKRRPNIHHRHPRSKGGDNTPINLARVDPLRHSLWHQIMENYSPLVQVIILRRLLNIMSGRELLIDSGLGEKHFVSVERRDSAHVLYSEYEYLEESFDELLDYNLTEAKQDAFMALFKNYHKSAIISEVNYVWGYPDFVYELTSEKKILKKAYKKLLSANDEFVFFRDLSEKKRVPA